MKTIIALIVPMLTIAPIPFLATHNTTSITRINTINVSLSDTKNIEMYPLDKSMFGKSDDLCVCVKGIFDTDANRFDGHINVVYDEAEDHDKGWDPSVQCSFTIYFNAPKGNPINYKMESGNKKAYANVLFHVDAGYKLTLEVDVRAAYSIKSSHSYSDVLEYTNNLVFVK